MNKEKWIQRIKEGLSIGTGMAVMSACGGDGRDSEQVNNEGVPMPPTTSGVTVTLESHQLNLDVQNVLGKEQNQYFKKKLDYI